MRAHLSVAMLWSACSLLSVLTAVVSVATAGDVVVRTPNGSLRGTRTAIGHDFYVDTFLRIPFAQPPVGKMPITRPIL